jgi:hypothetical protein
VLIKLVTTLNMIFSVTSFNCLAQYLVCGEMSPTRSVNVILFVIPGKKKLQEVSSEKSP